MHAHLDMLGQLVSMGSGFMPKSQQLDISCWATYHTLHQPSILGLATDFYVANEDKDTQDTMNARVLWHHFQTIKHQFGAMPPAPTGGSGLSWASGMVNSGSKPSTCTRPLSLPN